MNVSDVERLLAGGESETIEFKKCTAEITGACRTLCAFLNGRGGTVLIGVLPNGKMAGQEVADRTHQDLAQALRRFEPPAPVRMDFVPLAGAGRSVVVLNAPAAPESAPFVFEGRPYLRVGATTSLMPQEIYQQRLLHRLHSRIRWEVLPAEGIAMDHLDAEEIRRTVRLGISTGRLPEEASTDPSDALDRLELRREGRLSNGAAVLFGAETALRDYPQCVLRLARFRGTTKAEFLDSRQVRGHVFRLLDEAMTFLSRHLPVAARIEPGKLERVEEPLFPLAALREALVNALCHRDYGQFGGGVHVAIYDDRWEIWSTGTLPIGVTLEDLKRDHLSRPRNPLVAAAFYRRGLVEAWGRGTQRIVELCVAAGRPEPEFLEQGGSVGVRFLPSGYSPPHRIAYDLTPRQREILEILSRSASLTLGRVRAQLSDAPSERTLRREMDDLRHLGLVRSTGRTRGVVWALRHNADA
jgi:ATP-dependent DNA helicase RecG